MAKRVPDRLDIEVALAKKAGMSYGMWKAMHPRSAIPIKPEGRRSIAMTSVGTMLGGST